MGWRLFDAVGTSATALLETVAMFVVRSVNKEWGLRQDFDFGSIP